jgi:excinuclease ABC subunit C
LNEQQKKEKIDWLRAKANSLVEQPGCYLMKDASGKIIYIGKAKRLKNRVVSYFRQNKGHNEKVRKMVSHVDDFDYIVCANEFEALVLECSLIKQYSPKYNILLKDDKGYQYVKITNEPYPRILAAKQKQDDKATYLGPYTSSVKQLVDEVNKVFQLPVCSKKFPEDFRKTRPCLNYHIKNCAGICLGKLSQNDYQEMIKEALSYIKNGSADSIAALTKQMEEAAENLEFEKAAKLRDKLRSIQRLSQTQKVFFQNDKDQDFIGMEHSGSVACIAVLKFRNGVLHDKDDFLFYDVYDTEELKQQFLSQYYKKGTDFPKVISIDSPLPDQELYEAFLSQLSGRKISITVPQKGDPKRLIDMAQHNALEQLSLKLNKKSREIVALQQLANLLGLSSEPEYIESYDISNIGNDYMVGGMIVFQNAKPLRSAYKKFSMKENQTQDDYACMREMLSRRFQKYLDPNVTDEGFKRLPDLILLDGGKGHVSVITALLNELNLSVPVFGMVKDSRHRTRAIAVSGGEIQLSGYQSAFRLVTQIQDEVHRFAISYQRKKHQKNAFTLGLTSVPGIGEKKAFALLKAFKTQKALKAASPEELKKAITMKEETAQALYAYLQSL